jgi:hypothetical protein
MYDFSDICPPPPVAHRPLKGYYWQRSRRVALVSSPDEWIGWGGPKDNAALIMHQVISLLVKLFENKVRCSVCFECLSYNNTRVRSPEMRLDDSWRLLYLQYSRSETIIRPYII